MAQYKAGDLVRNYRTLHFPAVYGELTAAQDMFRKMYETLERLVGRELIAKEIGVNEGILGTLYLLRECILMCGGEVNPRESAERLFVNDTTMTDFLAIASGEEAGAEPEASYLTMDAEVVERIKRYLANPVDVQHETRASLAGIGETYSGEDWRYARTPIFSRMRRYVNESLDSILGLSDNEKAQITFNVASLTLQQKHRLRSEMAKALADIRESVNWIYAQSTGGAQTGEIGFSDVAQAEEGLSSLSEFAQFYNLLQEGEQRYSADNRKLALALDDRGTILWYVSGVSLEECLDFFGHGRARWTNIERLREMGKRAPLAEVYRFFKRGMFDGL